MPCHLVRHLASLPLCWCRGLGKPVEAEPLCRRALHIREQTYGTESPNVATALTALADVLKDMSRYNVLLCILISSMTEDF